MEKMKFKCRLLSDIILTDTSATEGDRKCLDFIPGNIFLGIATRCLYKEENDLTKLIFHSGHVRFGDAHLAYNGIRSIKIPADVYFPKYNGEEGEAYVYHCITDFNDELRKKQLKQGREGFYALDDNIASEINVSKQFAIKSAYNTSLRRSEDKKIFGYESMSKGFLFYFTVEIDDEAIDCREEIVKALIGHQHIGRSHTAQYGLVEIEQGDFKECASTQKLSTEVTVYADGRLIFFDDHGVPTFQPTAQQLGFKNGKVDWSKSQIRTFQYAPWNNKRHAFDQDRCGMEKGSVIVVNTNDDTLPTTDYVGCYQNEGFGKVIYNPTILRVNAKGNGRADVKFKKVRQAIATNNKQKRASQPHSPLMAYLQMEKQKHEDGKNIYKTVDDWVKGNKSLFQGDRFASQWGTIRGIAMATKDDEKILENISVYLTHGVAKAKWEDRGRWEKLNLFLKNNEKYNIRELVVNLASEMGKKCKQESE